MLSIDEAIAKERQLAERNMILLDSDELVKKSYDTYLRAEYHEQLVMWLEELKVLKENSISKEAFEKMKSRSHNHGHRQGYAKAIDDIVKFANTMPTVETEDGEIRPMWLEEMAEKLKKQKKTCFDCKNHFMSDCYLECYKHERINNDSICDDFE